MSNTPVATLDNMVCPYNKCMQNRTYNILECDYKTLTNNQKGFKFEMEVQNVLDNLHIDYTGNPNIWNSWIKEQGSSQDYDIKLDYNNLRIECKYVSVRPYHNSFLRDWYQRDCDIIVTSNKDLVSIQDKELLKSKGVKLLGITELFYYLSKLMYNPTIVFNYSLYNLDVLDRKEGEQEGEQAQTKGFVERFKSKTTKNNKKSNKIMNDFKIKRNEGIKMSKEKEMEKLEKELHPDVFNNIEDEDFSKNDYQNRKVITLRKARALAKLPKDEQMILYYRIISDGITTTKLRTIVRDSKKIKDRIYGITDKELREECMKNVFPILYDKGMNLKIANNIISKILGIDIYTSEKLQETTKILERIEEFGNKFPEVLTVLEDRTDNEGNMIIIYKFSMPEKEFAITKEEEQS